MISCAEEGLATTPGGSRRRTGVVQVNFALCGQLRQKKTGEGLGDGADLEDRVRTDRPIGEEAPLAVCEDADDDAGMACGSQGAGGEHRGEVVIEGGFEFVERPSRTCWHGSRLRLPREASEKQKYDQRTWLHPRYATVKTGPGQQVLFKEGPTSFQRQSEKVPLHCCFHEGVMFRVVTRDQIVPGNLCRICPVLQGRKRLDAFGWKIG